MERSMCVGADSFPSSLIPVPGSYILCRAVGPQGHQVIPVAHALCILQDLEGHTWL